MRLHVIKPSVNCMTVRVLVRAAGLDFEEVDAYGLTRGDAFLKLCPAHLSPMIEDDGLPRGSLWESCAIMQYLCNRHGLTAFYPTEPGARAMIDSAMFYVVGTLYPMLARATYGPMGFPLYAGEVGASDAGEAEKAKAQQAAQAALAEPIEVFRAFFLDGRPFIGGEAPSIADIRLACSLEFLAAIDYALPAWVADHRAAMEKALGAAYAEPAADVRGYIAYVKSQKT